MTGFGDRLATLRMSCGWTQAQLADKLGVKRGRVAHLERGRNQPTLAVVVACQRAFGCEWSALLGRAR